MWDARPPPPSGWLRPWVVNNGIVLRRPLLLLLLLMDKNCLAVQDCQARPQAFESAHILLFSINHQDSS